MTDIIIAISAVVTTATTVALALFTLRYVRLTQQMAETMESAREPFVDIELDHPNNDLRLVFVNTGGSTARGISFEVRQDCELIEGWGREGRGIVGMDPIAKGISYLPAGQRLVYPAGIVDAQELNGAFLTVVISYSNDAGRKFDRCVHYNLSQLKKKLLRPRRKSDERFGRKWFT